MNFSSKFIKILLIAILMALALIAVMQPKSTGTFVWNNFKFADLALFLNRDAALALKIGNYYFNVYGDGEYNLNKAEKYFYKSIEIDPKIPDAWHQLARIDFLRGDFQNALKKINKQIEIHGDSFMASFYIRGLISGFAGNYEQAENDFKKFIDWDPKNWAAYNDLSWIYFKKGDHKNMEIAALKGLEFAPKNPWLLNSLGASLLNQNKTVEAKNAFLKAKGGAESLSEQDWHKAYPGNDPKSAKNGLESMKEAIELNLRLANN